MPRLFPLAFALVALAGCPEAPGSAGHRCTEDSVCLKDLLCHPLAKVCVQACSTGADCPTNSKLCAAPGSPDGGAGTGKTFCQCQSTALCKGEADVICTDEEKLCAPKCTNDVDCTFGRKCDTATGNCRS